MEHHQVTRREAQQWWRRLINQDGEDVIKEIALKFRQGGLTEVMGLVLGEVLPGLRCL